MTKTIDFCPSCGGKEIEKVKEGVIYCPACDLTIGTREGKAKADPETKNVIEQIRLEQKRLAELIAKHDQILTPKPDPDQELW